MEQRLEFGGSISIEALTQLASSGATILIERAGRVVMRLIPDPPVDGTAPKRRLGMGRGSFQIADDFDELPPDLLAAFEGDDENRASSDDGAETRVSDR